MKLPPFRAPKRFKVNPVEIVIFAVAVLILGNSVQKIFTDWKGFEPLPMGAIDPTNPQAASRSLASSTQSFISLELKCGNKSKERTTAAKVRLSGGLCRGTPPISGDLLKTEITNKANLSSPTIFTDTASGKFLTDFIPLNTGDNLIQVRFQYSNGKSVQNEITIQKN